jgi:hypothetical protein
MYIIDLILINLTFSNIYIDINRVNDHISKSGCNVHFLIVNKLNI